jgi:N6-L-threonylcarbamoyladenine synthase
MQKNNKRYKIILGFETSCDETGVAIFDHNQGMRAHIIHSQIKRHQPFGGVVPELASREHMKELVVLVNKALQQAKLTWADLDAVAYTQGPGLAGALLVGTSFAKSLAFSLNIPAIPVHHLQAHILITLFDQPQVRFPFLALLVSGGHTILFYAKALNDYQVLGQTIDDACGEAFDKMAKHMGLAYPGGPKLAQLAQSGNPDAYALPRPMLHKQTFNMSFSGLKTAGRQLWDRMEHHPTKIHDFAASYQQAIIDVLIHKVHAAHKLHPAQQCVLAGGVAANQQLRQQLHRYLQKQGCEMIAPDISLCGDNGAMIAYAGYLNQTHSDQTLSIHIKPRSPIQAH